MQLRNSAVRTEAKRTLLDMARSSDDNKLPLLALLWDNAHDSCEDVLSPTLAEKLKLYFDMVVCSTECLLSRKVTADIVFVGSYCGYDFLDKYAILDHLRLKRTGIALGEALLLNNKHLTAPLLHAAGLKLKVGAGEYPRVVKRSDSCGSFDSYLVASPEHEQAALAELGQHAVIIEPFVLGHEYSLSFIGQTPTSVWDFRLEEAEMMTKEKKDERLKYFFRQPYDAHTHAFLAPVLAFMSQFALGDVTRVDLRVAKGGEIAVQLAGTKIPSLRY